MGNVTALVDIFYVRTNLLDGPSYDVGRTSDVGADNNTEVYKHDNRVITNVALPCELATREGPPGLATILLR